ncbi:uncharacterized protein LOC131975976 isoform X2 [Centropristis striata]|uniref:uncharacterized protein LOC131975976 isoform X2 n=1 Tax=Centropristis striata TaxID=184440 RepID=UPI0027E18233|nr:uncharacterized protein LOC131975976 isoform X2 [Centropristis striata]
MDLFRGKTLRDDEARVVEKAIRLAIDSVTNVLFGVNSSRSHEYERMVADRDKEIQRLEGRLTEMEHEMRLLRRQGCSCGLYGAEQSLEAAQTPAGPRTGEHSVFEQSCIDSEMTQGQQEYDMSISSDLFTRPISHVSCQSHTSALPSSPSRMALDQSCTPHSSQSSGAPEAARNLPTSPSSIVIKEEQCDEHPVIIKWEMSEERFTEHQKFTDQLCSEEESPSVNDLENIERRNFQENPHTEPGRHCDPEGEQLTNKKKGVPMSELTEEAQRLKRAAWRAASRRYYARKIARQQANPSRSGPFPPRPCPFPHITDNRYYQPISFADKRRRTLISELPEESQSLQREAWRAASRRYYARKTARHQSEPTQYAQLLQSMELSADTQGADRGPSQTSIGGIMCS